MTRRTLVVTVAKALGCAAILPAALGVMLMAAETSGLFMALAAVLGLAILAGTLLYLVGATLIALLASAQPSYVRFVSAALAIPALIVLALLVTKTVKWRNLSDLVVIFLGLFWPVLLAGRGLYQRPVRSVLKRAMLAPALLGLAALIMPREAWPFDWHNGPIWGAILAVADLIQLVWLYRKAKDPAVPAAPAS